MLLCLIQQQFSRQEPSTLVCVSGERVSCNTWWLDIPRQGALAGKGHTFEGMAIMFVSPYDDVSLQPGST